MDFCEPDAVRFLQPQAPDAHPSLLRAAREDPDAFAAFYDAHVERVLVFLARRILDAELAFDMTAETFAIALERIEQFRGTTGEEEEGWLFAIARSEMSRYWRHGKVERAAMLRLAVPRVQLSDEHLERIEDLAGIAALTSDLRDAMASLPSDQRVAVELRVVSELGYDELATTLGVTQQVARARVSRGLRALARRLTSDPQLLEGAA
jgi:RNA polymerase sigma-70 factor (ECF subfamily)